MSDATADPLRAALLDLHCVWKVYSDCGHKHEPGDGSVEIEDIGLTCELLYEICEECCTVDNAQTEQCASSHQHGPGYSICNTVATINTTPRFTPIERSAIRTATHFLQEPTSTASRALGTLYKMLHQRSN